MQFTVEEPKRGEADLPMLADVPAAKSEASLDLAAGDFAQSRRPAN